MKGIFTPTSVGIEDMVVANLITELITVQTQVSVYKSNTSVDALLQNPLLTNAQHKIGFLKNDILKAIDNNRKDRSRSIRLSFQIRSNR
jgi:hypothetical protein